jgi:hypothetical protein
MWVLEHGSSGGVLYHNNPEGTCGFCNAQMATILPKGANLWVVPPADAIAKNLWARQGLTGYVGNDAPMIPPRQYDLFRSQP